VKRFTGKVVLITGAGRGFGHATAERFLAEGADLALNYRTSTSREACDHLAAQAQAAGQRAVVVPADLADAAAVDAMVERVLAELGRVDILINNAGIMHVGPFVDSTEADWQAELAVNILGPLRVTRRVLPGMIARRAGRIVNLSSQLALTGWERGAVYAGTKGFLLTWTRSLAREVGQYQITVNAICPGSIKTDMNQAIYATPEAEAKRAAELPLRRLGTPYDVAEAALFFASAEANFLTGQYLGPNGGNVM
jgi:NAD(P)-dependent dehydrogenase (short-subunit alcohol dehydrogenase family)